MNNKNCQFLAPGNRQPYSFGARTKCPQNVEKNVRKMSQNCPEGLKTQFSDIFRTIFLPIWSRLLFGDPVRYNNLRDFLDSENGIS